MRAEATPLVVVFAFSLFVSCSIGTSLSGERRESLKQYRDAASSPEYKEWLQKISVNPLGEATTDEERRRLQGGCFPPFCGTTSTAPPTLPPSLPPTPDADTLVRDPANPYILVDFEDHISWNTANAYCVTQITNSVLASVNIDDTRKSQQAQIDAMTALCSQTPTGEDCWIGLIWSNNTKRYEWQNGQPLVPLSEGGSSVTNWADGGNTQPPDIILTGTAPLCVLLDNGNSYKWANTDCIFGEPVEYMPHAALCSNPLYEPYPTPDPTASPTKGPTKKPSDNPTKRPTDIPTKRPTDIPTKRPTDVPTKRPTEDPTKKPTDIPTKTPTDIPTKQPTDVPTKRPTEDPTVSPSTKPTNDPTRSPTGDPSASPTESPSSDPTTSPSEDPTATPSSDPTRSPSSDPTKKPSALPTVSPTKTPSSTPTQSPTKIPTESPSDTPTKTPTEVPTTPPTKKPTTVPTGSPTLRPTHHGQLPLDQLEGGPYNDADLLFIVQMPFEGRFIFDASASPIKENITEINAVRWSNGAVLGMTDTAVLDVATAPVDDYNVTLKAKPNTYGNYAVIFKAESASPTASPSLYPSISPTKLPTSAPSNIPSESPTVTPSAGPSKAPTDDPTAPPSKTPTADPTVSPSKVPTDDPSASPSKTPTEDPTVAPSKRPSAQPSDRPTSSPSKTPTDAPSAKPSASPTERPSAQPTTLPTDSPSSKPTAAPSAEPSTSPTDIPTDSPTLRPSQDPVSSPTTTPSDAPTAVTSDPSASPTDTPTELVSDDPSESPTPSPTETGDPCNGDQKEWAITFSCPGQPQFELVSTCPDGYAVQLRFEKIAEIDVDKHGVGNELSSWGERNKWKADLDFMWNGGDSGQTVDIQTVDGETRKVVVNKFSARLNKKLKGKGGRKIVTGAWFNITVFFFTDTRGGVFDLRGTGNPVDYTTVEANTLKYIIESNHWPFRRKADLLAMRVSYALKQANDPTLYACDSYKSKSAYGGGHGYGKKAKPKSKGKKGKGKKGGGGYGGNPWDSSSKRSSSSSRRRVRRLQSTSAWQRNENQRTESNEDGWGVYQSPCLTFSDEISQSCRNYAFGIDFRLESIRTAVVDETAVDMEEPQFLYEEWDGTMVDYYFARFDALEWDGPALFYLPTFEYYAAKEITGVMQGAAGDDGDHKVFHGEDQLHQPDFKTEDEADNGFVSKLMTALSWRSWIYVICGIAVFTLLICVCCCRLCYKIRQNTHEDKAFVQLE